MIELFVKGGPLMWPLLLCSVASVTISIERLFYWWIRSLRRDQPTIDKVFLLAENDFFDDALDLAGSSKSSEAGLLHSGLKHRQHGLGEALQLAAQDSIDESRRNMTALNTIITLAPLLGILGTVLGIISSFNILGLQGIQDPKAATGGVAEALITTAAGLSVAIVTLIPYNYFISRVRQLTSHLEKITISFQVACSGKPENQD
jgi:biopolymer transport protein ExbB